MIITDTDYGKFDMCLGDDGTMDTVIEICPHNRYIADQIGTKEIRFNIEYGANFRDDTGAMTDKGFNELAQEALDAYVEQYLLD